jgi:YD repeat-containing protein
MGLLYSFVIPDQGGYDLNGNLLSVTDSVMGQWNYAYDNLNRLTEATAPVSQPAGVNAYYAGVQPTWTYDPFGNRLTETEGKISGATPTASMPPSSTATYTPVGNQLATSTMASAILYDAAGDIYYDGTNYYLYDAEGRLCAVNNAGTLTGYIYDASGIRVAKGSLSSFSCNFASNGYATTSSYVLGPGGEQVTEYNGTGAWQHTNAFTSGALLASYHDTDTYFALSDWLGTKRAEISADGCLSRQETQRPERPGGPLRWRHLVQRSRLRHHVKLRGAQSGLRTSCQRLPARPEYARGNSSSQRDTLIGKIHLPETCANLCFGGAKRNRLFMTASQSLYALYVGTEGVPMV